MVVGLSNFSVEVPKIKTIEYAGESTARITLANDKWLEGGVSGDLEAQLDFAAFKVPLANVKAVNFLNPELPVILPGDVGAVVLDKENIQMEVYDVFTSSISITTPGGAVLTSEVQKLKSIESTGESTARVILPDGQQLEGEIGGDFEGATEFGNFKIALADVKRIDFGQNLPPMVRITSEYGSWERGMLVVTAVVAGVEENVREMVFEYSLDDETWHDIGKVAAPPYTVDWDTTSVIEAVDDSVWVKVIAMCADGTTLEDVTQDSFGVDNEPPTTQNDYDGKLHNEDSVDRKVIG
mgnify:CR=1 FL=1